MELKVIKNTPTNPHYTLILEYILGDSIVSGIQASIDFSESDENIKNLITVLEKLKGKKLKKRWGWMWNDEHYKEAVKEGILNKDDIKIIKNIEYDELLKSETEISFYVYVGYKIIYTDENGCIYPVEICL